MEDDFWWKTTFDGRQPLMEEDHWWKMTFDKRQPLMEGALLCETTFDGRWPLMEDILWCHFLYIHFIFGYYTKKINAPTFNSTYHLVTKLNSSEKWFEKVLLGFITHPLLIYSTFTNTSLPLLDIYSKYKDCSTT